MTVDHENDQPVPWGERGGRGSVHEVAHGPPEALEALDGRLLDARHEFLLHLGVYRHALPALHKAGEGGGTGSASVSDAEAYRPTLELRGGG